MLGSEEGKRGEDAQRREVEYGSGARGAYSGRTEDIKCV